MTTKKKRIIVSVIIFIVLAEICAIVIFFSQIKSITGGFTYSTPARDDKYGIEIDSPILIREVEMVQYYQDENGEIKLVLANYPIESVDNYVNPEFPDDIQSDIFYSDDIKFAGYELSKDVINAIAFSNIEKKEIKELQIDNVLEDNLVCAGNALVSASNDWQLGEIKITYKYIDCSKEYVIKAKIKDNEIIYTELFDIKTK